MVFYFLVRHFHCYDKYAYILKKYILIQISSIGLKSNMTLILFENYGSDGIIDVEITVEKARAKRRSFFRYIFQDLQNFHLH